MLRKQGEVDLAKRFVVQMYSEYTDKVERRGFTPISKVTGGDGVEYLVGFAHSSRVAVGSIKTNINREDNLQINWILGVDMRLVDQYNQVSYRIDKLLIVDTYVRLLDANAINASMSFVDGQMGRAINLNKNDPWYHTFANSIYHAIRPLNY